MALKNATNFSYGPTVSDKEALCQLGLPDDIAEHFVPNCGPVIRRIPPVTSLVSASLRASPPSLEHQCPALFFRLLFCVGHAVHFESIVVEKRDHSALVAELHIGWQRDDQCARLADRRQVKEK